MMLEFVHSMLVSEPPGESREDAGAGGGKKEGEVFAQRLVGEDKLRLLLVRIAEIAFGRVYTNTLGAFV
jgi:hypothetical protein